MKCPEWHYRMLSYKAIYISKNRITDKLWRQLHTPVFMSITRTFKQHVDIKLWVKLGSSSSETLELLRAALMRLLWRSL